MVPPIATVWPSLTTTGWSSPSAPSGSGAELHHHPDLDFFTIIGDLLETQPVRFPPSEICGSTQGDADFAAVD